MSRRADAPRDLLFGLLALHTGLVTRDQLVSAFGAWSAGPGHRLAALLVEQGAIDTGGRDLLLALAERQIQAHGGDAEKSLAALTLSRFTRESLAAAAGPDVDESLGHVPSGSTEPDADRTTTFTVGSVTGDGQRFRVLRPHAKGGLGAVYVALDEELHREVALKQILDDRADDDVSRQRFLLEAEVTGGLEHPGIVPVYSLGAYADGRPFYAMRFIKGDSLKEAIAAFHADDTLKRDPGRRSLELRKLLRRFLDVCNAIDYAHARGVLHRDIKPGNVIVGRYGETLVVDWGLAKATGRRDPETAPDERTLTPASSGSGAETLPGQALGTPAYMSPEQAAGDLGRLGPASDVYSLGATLYCLLTGKAPFEGEVGEVLRNVQRGEFPKPRHLDRSIDPALEAVCLKAMAREPGDRYTGCRALADDVEHWLADEPVSAYREPPSRRARRWAKRNRTAVTAAAAAIVAGLIGLAALSAAQARANRLLIDEQAKTARALIAETEARRATQEALGQSEESRRRSEAVLAFLKDDVLAAARPEGQEGGLGVDVTVRRAVDAAEPKIAERFKEQPLVEADVRDTLGATYRYLKEALLASRQFERSSELRRSRLGPEHPDTLTSRSNLALAYFFAGRTKEAIALHEETLGLREAWLGPDHPDTLVSRNDLAMAYYGAGRTKEAIALDEVTLKQREARLGPEHPDTLSTRNNLAEIYRVAGRPDKAITLLEVAVKQREARFGPGHPDALTSRNNLALAYMSAGLPEKAMTLLEVTLKQREARLGPEHPDTLSTRNNLADAYRAAGRPDEAIALQKETLRRREAKLGPDHPDTLRSRNNLALAYYAAHRLDEAIELLEAVVKQRERQLGADHPETLSSRNNLALAYHGARRTGEAIALHEAVLRRREARLGPDHPDTLTSRHNLALAYVSAGRTREAVALLEAVLRLRREKIGPDHPYTASTRNNLASAYESLGRWSVAEPLRREDLAGRRKRERTDAPSRAGAFVMLGANLIEQSKWSEAETLLREYLAIAEEAEPGASRRFHAMSLLGAALLGQRRYADAEPQVVGGYEGMAAHPTTSPARERRGLNDAAQRVVRLYEAWGKPEQARAWAEKLGLADLPADVFARP